MADEALGKYTVGFGLSFAITSVLSAILVVLKEENKALHDWMVALTGHHWITHGVLALAVFVVLGYLLSRNKVAEKWGAPKLTNVIVSAVIISVIIIAGYFLIE